MPPLPALRIKSLRILVSPGESSKLLEILALLVGGEKC